MRDLQSIWKHEQFGQRIYFGSGKRHARIIESIRRECLDHVITFDEALLRRTLRSYFRYYRRSRLHLSLDKDSPDPRSVQSIGRVIAIAELGGLHHRYEQRAA